MKLQAPAFAAACIVLLALAACGNPVSPGNGSSQEPARGDGSVVISSTENLPDWLLVAYQRDCARGEGCPRGEVKFNQRTITRAADGTADIWVQVRHGMPQLFAIESETTETTVRFYTERLRYRFNCANGQFYVAERHIMGANETVVARDNPEPIYRSPVRGSLTSIIQPIACRSR